MGYLDVSEELNNYIEYYRNMINQNSIFNECLRLKEYSLGLIDRVSRIAKLKESNDFWEDVSGLLEIDSKLQVLNFFSERNVLGLDVLSEEEMLKMMDNEYSSYYLESMGYKLNERKILSVLFLIMAKKKAK